MNKQNWPFTNPIDPNIYNERTNWPKISIVTPSYNQGQYIEETILSILNQNYPNLEYIIIDGGSTDNTVEIIKKYEDRITYWVSEKDNGQTHAINKGFEQATGEIYAYLNSDDFYTKFSLYEVAREFDNNTGIIVGICTEIPSGRIMNPKDFVLDINEQLDYFCYSLPQPSSFWSSKEHQQFDENFNYTFDRLFFLKQLLKKVKFSFLEYNLSYFRLHTSSKTTNSELIFDFENYNVNYMIISELDIDISVKKKLIRIQKIIYNRLLMHKVNTPRKLIYLFKVVSLKPSYLLTREFIGFLKKQLL